jgi:4-amino-4-deoxy-L-arabinose transferase-like glycosyltransferase
VLEHKQERKKTVRFIAFKLFGFFVAVYILTSGFNFYGTDAGQLRIEVARSIIERFDLSIPDGIGIKGTDGREYSWVGIGSALLAVPFFIAGKLIGSPENAVSIMNQIVGAATVVLVFLFSISLGYSKRASLFVAIFYGLGTMAWPLTKQAFDHTVETFFVLLSVYCMYLYVVNKKFSRLLLSAFSLGVAFITRQTSILVIPPLFMLMIVYYSKKSGFRTTVRLMARDVVLFFFAFLPFIVLILWYNHYRFGSIFEAGYSLYAARTGIDFFTGTSLLTGLSGFLISSGKGFFYYSPVAILFFFSIKGFIKKHTGLGVSFIFIMISYLFFLSKNLYWHGDWAWGPRYIFVLTPFFIIPIAELLDSKNCLEKSFRRLVVYSIFALSIVIQLAAVSVDFHKYFLNLQIKEKIKFTVAHGDGVQPIVEPPPEIYFDWHRSPILAQFRFIYKMADEIKDYRYSEPPEDAADIETIKVHPLMHVFDFWWLCKYFLEGSYSGLIVVPMLLLVSIYYASGLWKAVTQNSC